MRCLLVASRCGAWTAEEGGERRVPKPLMEKTAHPLLCPHAARGQATCVARPGGAGVGGCKEISRQG